MTYAIFAKYHFYRGTLNAKHDGLLRDDYDGSVVAFASRDDADALCRMLNDHGPSPIELAHGQYAPAEYSVRESSARPQDLNWAMRNLGLQHDFNSDGSRIAVTS